jgi:ankyrin repeat protein
MCFDNGQENQKCFSTAFQNAARNHNLIVSKSLLDAGANPDLCCPVHKMIRLKTVILKSSAEMALWLLNNDASLNDEYSLCEAIIQRNFGFSDEVNFMHLLLDHGAVLDLKDERSTTLIIQSLKWNRDGLFYYLMEKEIDVNTVSKFFNETPLQYAAAHAGEKTTKFVVSRGALIGTGTGKYGNALQARCEWEHDELKAAEVLS